MFDFIFRRVTKGPATYHRGITHGMGQGAKEWVYHPTTAHTPLYLVRGAALVPRNTLQPVPNGVPFFAHANPAQSAVAFQMGAMTLQGLE